MEVFFKAAQFIAALSLLVGIHELGHYLAARAIGVRVDKFYLFFDAFGFKLFKFKKGDTEYGIGWLPLGGYVKVAGIIDESMDKSFIGTEPKSFELRSKPAWQRLIFMLAGIIMNLLLAFIIFAGHIFYYGEHFIPASELKNGIKVYSLGREAGFQDGDVIVGINGQPVRRANDILSNKLLTDKGIFYTVERQGKIEEITINNDFAGKLLTVGADSLFRLNQSYAVSDVSFGSGADRAGLRHGDSIMTINGKMVRYFADLQRELRQNAGKEVALTYKRGPELHPVKASVSAEGLLGFKPEFNDGVEYFGLGKSISLGAVKVWTTLRDYMKGIGRLITGDLPAKKSLHGLIGIANTYSPTWDWNSFWLLTATISVILAFMNLLPIPALDGGHVFFILIELVRGRPVGYKVLEVAQLIGLGAVFLLMGFALWNDIAEYILKIY